MICPNCHQASLKDTICSVCGTPIPPENVDRVEHSSDSGWSLKTTVVGMATLAAWGIVLFIAYVKTVRWSGGTSSAEARGYLVGGFLTPAVVAIFIVWLINRSRRDKMPTQYKHALTAFLASFISIVSLVGSLQNSEKSLQNTSIEKQMGHLLKQAAGKETATNANWYDEPTRVFLRDMLSLNQEYTQAVGAIRSPAAKLYTPASYATRSNLRGTISEFQALMEVDTKYESVQPIFARLESNVAAADASSNEKQEFLKGVHSTADKTLAPRTDTFRAEEEWIQATIELYQFNLAHFSDYEVHGNKLLFHQNASRLQFEALQSKSIALRKVTLESKSKLDATRAAASTRLGVTLSDVSPNQNAK